MSSVPSIASICLADRDEVWRCALAVRSSICHSSRNLPVAWAPPSERDPAVQSIGAGGVVHACAKPLWSKHPCFDTCNWIPVTEYLLADQGAAARAIGRRARRRAAGGEAGNVESSAVRCRERPSTRRKTWALRLARARPVAPGRSRRLRQRGVGARRRKPYGQPAN